MSATIIIDNSFFTLSYHPDTKIVHHEIKVALTHQAFINLLTGGEAALKSNQAVKWLSDDRKYSGLTAENMEWSGQWLPGAMAETGWRYWARVVDKMPPKPIQDQFVAGYGGYGLVAKLFTDINVAMKWLEEQV
jgi:hypothetical protein